MLKPTVFAIRGRIHLERFQRTVEPNVSRSSVGIVRISEVPHPVEQSSALHLLALPLAKGGIPPSLAHFSRRTREGDQVFLF